MNFEKKKNIYIIYKLNKKKIYIFENIIINKILEKNNNLEFKFIFFF